MKHIVGWSYSSSPWHVQTLSRLIFHVKKIEPSPFILLLLLSLLSFIFLRFYFQSLCYNVRFVPHPQYEYLNPNLFGHLIMSAVYLFRVQKLGFRMYLYSLGSPRERRREGTMVFSQNRGNSRIGRFSYGLRASLRPAFILKIVPIRRIMEIGAVRPGERIVEGGPSCCNRGRTCRL